MKTLFLSSARSLRLWVVPVVLGFSACASEKNNADPGYSYADNDNSLLWEISGNGLKEPSYLYGTIHIQRREVFEYDTVVSIVFNKSAAYAMELNMEEIDPMKAAALMQTDKPLDSILSPEKYRQLDSLFLAHTGMNLSLMKKTKPFFLMAQIMQLQIGGDMPVALDLDFFEKAREQKKKLIGIEKFEEQMAAVDELSIEEQTDLILEGYKDGEAPLAQIDELLEAYLNAEVQKMAELSKDTLYPEKFHRAFLQERNIRMADRIAEIVREQVTFNAVGAAHLGGEEGVITLLRQKGFELKPIKTAFKASSSH